uniref:DUF874 family protein n=1 Tax=Helicobacter pylori TaxID=210 RepID=UPI003C6C7CC7
MTHVACKKAKELDDKVQDKSKQAEKENQINWWKYSGLTIAASLLLAACSAGDIDKQIELEQEKQEANKSGIELANSQIKAEQERQKTEQEKQKTNNTQKDLVKEQKDLVKEQKDLVKEQKDLVKEQKDLVKEQKDFIKYAEQNCQEKHGQLFIKKTRIKTGITTGIAIEIEAECKTPKPAKTNQTPTQPKHLPNSKQPHSQRGSK